MKKLVLIMIAIAISMSVMAQEKTKVKELGVKSSGYGSYGLSYKFGNQKSLWRIAALTMSGRNHVDAEDDENGRHEDSHSFEVKFGKSFIVPVKDKLELRLGADLSFGFSQNSRESEVNNSSYNYTTSTNQIIYKPGVNLVLGMNYFVTDQFLVGFELLPYFTYGFGTSEVTNDGVNGDRNYERDITSINYSFSNSVYLTLAYRF